MCIYCNCNYMIYNRIYFLTAIGLTPGGSSTIHIHTQTIHRTTQSTQTIHRTTQLIRKSAGRAPSLQVIPCLITEEKSVEKTLSQGSRNVIKIFGQIIMITDYCSNSLFRGSHGCYEQFNALCYLFIIRNWKDDKRPCCGVVTLTVHAGI
jgi:hypothetical protein